MSITELLEQAVQLRASDLHITAGLPPTLRLNGQLKTMDAARLSPQETLEMAKAVLNEEKFETFLKMGEVDFSYVLPGVASFRINAYFQRGSVGLACRVINDQIPTIDSLGLPESIKQLANRPRGLIIVTGPTGSGKSTTMAAMIDQINEQKFCHIVTLEDPIEYLHKNKKSIINQREIGKDTMNFPNGLRAALRQDPDVILVGEMRDLETIGIAITAAETGHLVLATLHTQDAPSTVERIIDVFPAAQQEQIRVQLASSLVGVISQRLLRRKDGKGRVAAVEMLFCTPAVRNLIRDKKTYQVISFMQTGAKFGMQTMDTHLQMLYDRGIITAEEAMEYAVDLETMSKFFKLRSY